MHAQAQTLYRAGLLAGLGTGAAPGAVAPGLSAAAPGLNTCIDGGSGLLFAVSAPGRRCLRVWTQQAATGDTQPWTAWHGSRAVGTVHIASAGLVPARWGLPEPAGARHAALALAGRLYRVDRAERGAGETAAGPPTWWAYQLGRHADPGPVLEQLGCAQAWRQIEAVWARLLGRPLPRRSRPWSVSLPGAEGPAADSPVRTASSLWALAPEMPEKYARLADTVAHWGGDGRYAEALYKLLTQAVAGDRPRIVGSALEITVRPDGALLAIDFVLRSPRETPLH